MHNLDLTQKILKNWCLCTSFYSNLKAGLSEFNCRNTGTKGPSKSTLGLLFVYGRVHCTRCQISAGANAPAAPVLHRPLVLRKDAKSLIKWFFPLNCVLLGGKPRTKNNLRGTSRADARSKTLGGRYRIQGKNIWSAAGITDTSRFTNRQNIKKADGPLVSEALKSESPQEGSSENFRRIQIEKKHRKIERRPAKPLFVRNYFIHRPFAIDGEKELDFVVHETYIKGTVIQSKNFQGFTWNQIFHPSKYIVCSDSSEKSFVCMV